MKKLLFYPLVFIGLPGYVNAQKEIDFKNQYKPNYTYNQTMYIVSNSVVTYNASQDLMDALKQQGVENPTVKDSKKSMQMVIKTGQVKNNVFPLTMKFGKTTGDDGKAEIPEGTIFYGKDTIGKPVSFDSISDNGMDSTLKYTMLDMMETMLQQVNLPERKLKVGDTFIVNTPLKLPLATVAMDMNIMTIYKLSGVKDNIATFDITQVDSMKMKISDQDMYASGGGTGQIIYDCKEQLARRFEMNTDIEMKMSISGISINVKSKGKDLVTTTGSGN